MLNQALDARLKLLQEEFWRLTNLAPQTAGKDQQEDHWLMAKDLQREAQELRGGIRKQSQPTSPKPAAHP